MQELIFKIPYDSVDDIPLEEYKNLFKQYWTFIASNKLNYKPDICDGMGYWLYLIDKCFACEYASRLDAPVMGRCEVCPLTKYRNSDDDFYPCACKGSPYENWRRTGSPRFAMEIAELEWEDRSQQ